MGDKKLPGIAAEDIGRCAYGIFKRPDLIGKTVGIAGEHLTGAQMAAALSRRRSGQPVVHAAVPPEVYRGFGFPGADDLGNMFQFKRDFEQRVLRGARPRRSRARSTRSCRRSRSGSPRTRTRIPLEA